MVIRIYASSVKCWDDGIGYVIAGESEESIDRYVKHTKWSEHPHQTFQLYQNAPGNKVYCYYGDVMEAKEVTEEVTEKVDLRSNCDPECAYCAANIVHFRHIYLSSVSAK